MNGFLSGVQCVPHIGVPVGSAVSTVIATQTQAEGFGESPHFLDTGSYSPPHTPTLPFLLLPACCGDKKLEVE